MDALSSSTTTSPTLSPAPTTPVPLAPAPPTPRPPTTVSTGPAPALDTAPLPLSVQRDLLRPPSPPLMTGEEMSALLRAVVGGA